jgi:hypothetical protein
MTKTFAEQAQTYFELYRKLIEEIKETELSIRQLQVKQQDLTVQKNHMSKIIVNHIDTGNDIMMCALRAEEKTGAMGADEVASIKMNHSPYIHSGTISNPSLHTSMNTSLNTMLAQTHISGALGGSEWNVSDIGMGTVDIYSSFGRPAQLGSINKNTP